MGIIFIFLCDILFFTGFWILDIPPPSPSTVTQMNEMCAPVLRARNNYFLFQLNEHTQHSSALFCSIDINYTRTCWFRRRLPATATSARNMLSSRQRVSFYNEVCCFLEDGQSGLPCCGEKFLICSPAVEGYFCATTSRQHAILFSWLIKRCGVKVWTVKMQQIIGLVQLEWRRRKVKISHVQCNYFFYSHRLIFFRFCLSRVQLRSRIY